MVTAIVSELGKVRPTCFARTMLFAATRSLEFGDIVKAGCQLREAVNRYLLAMCEAHDCMPRKKLHRTPARLARKLYRKGACEFGDYTWLREMIDCGNRCARCKPVRGSLVETGIMLMHLILDHCPEILLPERQGGTA